MTFASFVSKRNLERAWQYINTGSNVQYKQFFRPIYRAYSLSASSNLTMLRRHLLDGTYEPLQPTRIYYPKPSGLQRPITLLHIEDQIVYQAFGNIFMGKIREKRRPLIGKAVFSNWPTGPGSKFFLSQWHFGYRAMRRFIMSLYKQGYVWIGKFDLSAFFDTIDHELLIKSIHPRGGASRYSELFRVCLHAWSSHTRSSQYRHGIPQGPIASQLLAECIMLPVDRAMTIEFKYARYVDDIRILGKSELEVRQGIVYLDSLCRDRGLIPSADKHGIRRATSRGEALDGIASLASYGSIPRADLKPKKAERLFSSALNKHGDEIVEKTKLRLALFRAQKSRKILNRVVRLWEHFPEHTDAYVVFLSNYERSKQVVDLSIRLLQSRFPYDFVRGELWKLLGRMGSVDEIGKMIELAVETVKKPKKGVAARYGAYTFLCRCEREGLGNYSRWMKWEKDTLLQSLAAPYLRLELEGERDVVRQMLIRSSPEPGLALVWNFFRDGTSPVELNADINKIQPVARSAYSKLDLLPPLSSPRADAIDRLLVRRYRIARWNRWRNVFSNEYRHSHQILLLAEALFDFDPSSWLLYQDAFNEALFRAFQKILDANNAPGTIATIHPNGKLKDYGAMLFEGPFVTAYPTLANELQSVHDRRVKLPGAHPYQKHTGRKTIALKKREQRTIVVTLERTYTEFIHILSGLGI
jgi:hypothetical protein